MVICLLRKTVFNRQSKLYGIPVTFWVFILTPTHEVDGAPDNSSLVHSSICSRMPVKKQIKMLLMSLKLAESDL